MDNLTHKIEITISGRYPHGENQYASISISGDGGLEHMTDAFKSALIAAGFSLDIAKRTDKIQYEETNIY